ncbi:Leucine Rich Repeat [Seminavis robusta]|uniref:Leucine Rich Repeat n=1 Tax=Seminavis robusta TaxID=568900 RepID=A0A9N8DMU7_9STRA|nr:Leucine Rich Repeat [Seminavis robusta]|eukprot:Sro165_g073980.1 Leucine Rich Repeat (875) ;mRNA; r:89780-92493
MQKGSEYCPDEEELGPLKIVQLTQRGARAASSQGDDMLVPSNTTPTNEVEPCTDKITKDMAPTPMCTVPGKHANAMDRVTSVDGTQSDGAKVAEAIAGVKPNCLTLEKVLPVEALGQASSTSKTKPAQSRSQTGRGVAIQSNEATNFDVMKVVEARARDASMNLQRVEYVDAETGKADSTLQIGRTQSSRRAAGIQAAVPVSPSQTTIARNETNYEMKVLEARACRAAALSLQSVQTLDRQQPGDISPTMGLEVLAVNQSVRPGAYAGVPGASVRRNTDIRLSLLGREGLFGSEPMTSFQSENFEDGPSETNGNRLSVAIPVDEPSTTNIQTAQELPTISEPGQDLDEARIKRRKENLKATLKIARAGLLFILIIVLLLAFLLPDKDQVEATQSKTTAPPMSMSTTTAPTSMESLFLSLLPEHTTKALEDTASAQYQAFRWLREDPFIYGYSEQRILQRYALMTVFYSTAGPTQWFNKTGWGSYHLHECAWFQNQEFALKSFVGKLYPGFLRGFLEPLPDSQCDKQGLYQHLWLDQNHLVGSLPEELYSLTSLKTLSAGLNPLYGSLSSYIGQLTELQGLVIFTTGLSGSIPKEIGSMSSFKVIGLNDNKLEGSIPDELWQLSSLDSLVLGRNEKLRGTIPSSIGTFPKLRWLLINECNLSGSIPKELGQATSLEWLVLLGNQLSGTLSSELGALSKLWIVSLSGNLLQGTLPSQLGLLTSSYRMTLRHNFFTGTLPSELGIPPLQWLVLESNQLSGTIPSAFSGLSNLEFISLGNNSFTGEIPSEFGLLTLLGRLTMENNLLHGTVPAELASLQESLYSFRIDGNSLLSGVIPEPLCTVNGTCIGDSLVSHCEGSSGSSFDCTELLCGCECPC